MSKARDLADAIFTTVDVNGGTIDGTVIGNTTTAAISATTGTFTDAVTGSNLNVSNWDTAFGWGNHASAGYLTSTYTGDINVTGELIVDSYNETYVALSGTSVSVNCEAGNVFSLTTSGTTTFTFTNPPASGIAYGMVIEVTAGGTHTLNWPSSVDWGLSTAPDSPASGETDIYTFYTRNGGTTWYGFQSGDAMG